MLKQSHQNYTNEIIGQATNPNGHLFGKTLLATMKTAAILYGVNIKKTLSPV